MSVRRSGWFRCFHPRPYAPRRLICFPHAGGGAGFFRSWSDDLPADIELWAVQYPGREDRFGEPRIVDMATLADLVADALTPALDRPVAVFGHSMGASVGHEVTRRLLARRPGSVERLFVSARPGPRHQSPPADPVYLRDDDGVLAELGVLGGTHADLLGQPDLRAALLPVIRDDFRLVETYQPAHSTPLDVGIVTLTGAADPRVPIAHANAWRDTTRGTFDLAVFDGGHFFVIPRRREVLAEIVRALSTGEDSMELPEELSEDGIRAAVARILDIDPATIGAADNLLVLGLDSITMMLLASQWQRYQFELPFVQLAEEPTVANWARLLREAAGTHTH